MTREEIAGLRKVTASQGIMLESTSERLCMQGGVHYGSPDKKDEFETLLKYSPLHNLKEGTSYPAVLVTTGDHDDRVVPGHSFKFAAALQAGQTGDAPILIRIDTDAATASATCEQADRRTRRRARLPGAGAGLIVITLFALRGEPESLSPECRTDRPPATARRCSTVRASAPGQPGIVGRQTTGGPDRVSAKTCACSVASPIRGGPTRASA
jgi:hypothetical protein